MPMTLLLLAGLAASAAGAPAVTGEALVEWESQPKARIIADEVIWTCDGSSCRGTVVDTSHSKQRSCRRLAIYAGRVLSYRTPTGELGTDELRRCNAGR